MVAFNLLLSDYCSSFDHNSRPDAALDRCENERDEEDESFPLLKRNNAAILKGERTLTRQARYFMNVF